MTLGTFFGLVVAYVQQGSKGEITSCSIMGSEEKDASKMMDWKSIGEQQGLNGASEAAPVKKRLPRKIRQVPDYYFLPRRSLPSAILFYGAWIAGGIGAGMLTEIWINKKVKEDGGVIWEFDK